MTSRAVRRCYLILLGLWAVLAVSPARAALNLPPPESLAGLTPGISQLENAERYYGLPDVMLPGFAAYNALGVCRAYRWIPGGTLGGPGLTVSIPYDSTLISLVMVEAYPGLTTTRGLTVLMEDTAAAAVYGRPDFALQLSGGSDQVRELYYMNTGLLVVCRQIGGQVNWVITRMILTYPAVLGAVVTERLRYPYGDSWQVRDVTFAYRDWAPVVPPSY